jgi:hypothetical protein
MPKLNDVCGLKSRLQHGQFIANLVFLRIPGPFENSGN